MQTFIFTVREPKIRKGHYFVTKGVIVSPDVVTAKAQVMTQGRFDAKAELTIQPLHDNTFYAIARG